MSEAVWKPTEDIIKNANITAFMNRHEIRTYEELILRCTTGIEWFWDSCVHETGIYWFEPYTELLSMSAGFAFSKWFIGGRLNITYNCVDRHAEGASKFKNKTAVIWQGECGAEKKITYAELAEQTNQVAGYLKSLGIGKGDAVALYLPMIPELIPIFYGVLKVGAVLVPIFSAFGTEAVTDRLQDAKVQVVFTCDGTLRSGKTVPLKANLDEALEQCPAVRTVAVVRRLFQDNVPMKEGRDQFFDQAVSNFSESIPCEELPSEAPSLVIYTSGTTGKPKGTVHTHAGVLAQVTKELFFNFDLKPEDIFFWVTDIGWMMGPWEIIGTHHFGATLVIAEGAPHYPEASRALDLVQKHKVTHFGVSPTLIRLLMRQGLEPDGKKLKSLRVMGSTGEPWDDDSYMWCFEKIGQKKVPIMNISGGTEIMGCLLAPLIIRELKPSSLQSPGLGMAVDIFNENGYQAEDGEVGYLVCKKPAPSMTKGFLGDRERYLETYFSKFPNVWNHGDWAVRDKDGHWYLKGRADDTIKIAGKRTGPAEIESVLCSHPFVSEACAIGVPDDLKGQALVTFVVLVPGVGVTRFLMTDLRNQIVTQLGKTMAAKEIHVVEGLAKTRSGKIVRSTIKKKYLGEDLGSLASLDDPKQLEWIPQAF